MDRLEGLLGSVQSLPNSLEAEQSVLGAVLIAPECFTLVAEKLREEYFYRDQNGAIYSVMADMYQRGTAMDPVTVLNEVMREEIFPTPEEAKVYLANLAETVPTAAHVETYCQILREKYVFRQVLAAAQEIAQAAAEAKDSQQLLDYAEQKIYAIRHDRGGGSLRHIRYALGQALETLQQLTGENSSKFRGLSSGFSELDKMITGLNKSDLILVAARPGMGKTAFALNIAQHVATKENKVVAIFSLEMSSEQIVTRFMSSAASVESQKFRTGMLVGEEWQRVPMVSDQLMKTEIYLDDSAGVTLGEMLAKLRRMKQVDLVIIDYLQLMSSGRRRTENRVQEVSEITRGLKVMAKELNVPVLTLSQLSRGPESRADKRPMLSDLRESGSIEQDADIVLLLYREDYYLRDAAQEHNTAICTVAKNRHGDVGDVKLGWDGRYTRFTTLEYGRNEP